MESHILDALMDLVDRGLMCKVKQMKRLLMFFASRPFTWCLLNLASIVIKVNLFKKVTKD